MPIADQIADRLLSQDIDLARFEAGERRMVLRLLSQLRKDIIALLAGNDPSAPKTSAFQRARLEKMLPEVESAIKGAYRSISRQLGSDLGEVALSSGQATAQTVNATVGADLMTSGLSESALKALLDTVALEGAPVQEWWERQAGFLRQRFHDEMRQGLLINEQLSQLMRRVRGFWPGAERSAERIVRTSLISTQNAARNAVYEANDDVLKGVQWLATLDTRTCPICRALSGKVWTVPDHRPVGHNTPWPGPLAHWQCRCTQVPVVKAAAQLMRARGQRLERQIRELETGKRRALDGGVATDLTFNDWLRIQPETKQRAILGTGRFDLWKRGRLRLDQMISQDHRILTLDQLKAKAA